jgi:prolyl-tRNA synthetase
LSAKIKNISDFSTFDVYYNSVIDAYKKIYDRLGIGQDTYVTFASGGAFTKFSHEFQTICEAGEDVIYVHEGKNLAVNEEVLDDKNLASLGIKREELKEVKSAEVGNIFNFGTQKSEDMDFSFLNEAGEKQFVHLGSYGVGITRVMGVIVEKSNDERGIIWPEAVAPFQVHLVGLDLTDQEVKKQAEKVYQALVDQGIEVLFDDRTDVTAGAKFADYDLIGVPYRLVVSKKSGDEVEIKKRAEKETNLVSLTQFISSLSR